MVWKTIATTCNDLLLMPLRTNNVTIFADIPDTLLAFLVLGTIFVRIPSNLKLNWKFF